MAKIGISTWVWTSPLSLDKLKPLAARIRSLGFDIIEIPIEATGDLDYREAARVIHDAGLEVTVCAVIGADRDLIHEDRAVRSGGMAYVRHCIDAAHVLGATNVVGPLYSAVGRTWQATEDERRRDEDLLVGELRALALHAGERGVTICVEPLNRFETSFLNLTAQAIAIVDRVGHPACGLILDTFHMNIDERSIGDAIRAAGPRLRHMHACENDRGAPGSGHLPWDDVARATRDIGFDGPFVIESFASDVKAMARATCIWRPLAASPDALAGDGVRFLRRLLG
jgi:D-psicose/D-tagatose/L-ribulose 3-epimerase